MAPEVVLCRPYNESADIFSLTIIIYEILSKTVSTPAVMTSSEHYDYALNVCHMPDSQFAKRAVLQVVRLQR